MRTIHVLRAFICLEYKIMYRDKRKQNKAKDRVEAPVDILSIQVHGSSNL